MSHIRWTDEEKEKLVRMSFELYLADLMAQDFLLVDEAQKRIFAPDRCRSIKTLKHPSFLFIKEGWTKLMAMVRAGEELPPLPPKYVPPPPPVVEKEVAYEGPVLKQQSGYTSIVPVVNPQVEREYSSDEVPATPRQDFADELMARLSTTLLSQLLTQDNVKAVIREVAIEVVNQVLDERTAPPVAQKAVVPSFTREELTPAPKHSPEQRGSDRVTYRKVLILGLSNAQESILMHEYPGVEFFFLSGAEGRKRLEQTHQASELTLKSPWVKGQIHTKNWRNLVNVGGMDGIRNQLKDRFGMIPLK